MKSIEALKGQQEKQKVLTGGTDTRRLHTIRKQTRYIASIFRTLTSGTNIMTKILYRSRQKSR